MKLKKLIEELNLFERERTPTEIRLFGIATCSIAEKSFRKSRIGIRTRDLSGSVVWLSPCFLLLNSE